MIRRFGPLMTLTVRHDYHGAGEAPVALEPDAATAALAARPDLGLRLGPGRAEAFAAEDRAALVLLAGGGPLVFTFRLRARDPQLAAVTAPAGDGILVAEGGPEGPLHPGETLGPEALRPAVPGGLVTEADLHRRPLAIVRLRVAPTAEDARFALRLAARARVWTYHVIGGAADAAFQVQDRAGAVGFTPLGPRLMANGARAQSFRSDAAIAERARPGVRFELLAEGPFGPRSVIETLPCPAPGSGGPDVEGGAGGAADIYVNL